MNWLNFMTKQQHKNTLVEPTEAIWGKTSMQLLQKNLKNIMLKGRLIFSYIDPPWRNPVTYIILLYSVILKPLQRLTNFNPLVTDRKKALFDLLTLELDHSFVFNQFWRATSYFEAK